MVEIPAPPQIVLKDDHQISVLLEEFRGTVERKDLRPFDVHLHQLYVPKVIRLAEIVNRDRRHLDTGRRQGDTSPSAVPVHVQDARRFKDSSVNSNDISEMIPNYRMH